MQNALGWRLKGGFQFEQPSMLPSLDTGVKGDGHHCPHSPSRRAINIGWTRTFTTSPAKIPGVGVRKDLWWAQSPGWWDLGAGTILISFANTPVARGHGGGAVRSVEELPSVAAARQRPREVAAQ